MLALKSSNNRIHMKVISLIVAQILFIANLGYTNPGYNKLRLPVGKSNSRLMAAFLEYVIEHPGARHAEIVKALGTGHEEVSEELIASAVARLKTAKHYYPSLRELALELDVPIERLRTWLYGEFKKLHPGKNYRSYFGIDRPQVVIKKPKQPTVVPKNKIATVILTEVEVNLLRYMSKNPLGAQSKIAEAIGIARETVSRHISRIAGAMNISKDTRGRDTQSTILNWLEAQGGLEQLIQHGVIKIKYTISEEAIMAACNRLGGDIGYDLEISKVSKELGVSSGRLSNWLSQEFTKLHPGERYQDYFQKARAKVITLNATSDDVDIELGPEAKDPGFYATGRPPTITQDSIESARDRLKQKSIKVTLPNLAIELGASKEGLYIAQREGRIDMKKIGIKIKKIAPRYTVTEDSVKEAVSALKAQGLTVITIYDLAKFMKVKISALYNAQKESRMHLESYGIEYNDDYAERGQITIENIRQIMREENLTNPALSELAAALGVTEVALRQAIRRGKINKDDLAELGVRYRSAIGSSI